MAHTSHRLAPIRTLAIALLSAAAMLGATAGSASALVTPNQKRVCAYTSSNSVSGLQSFASLAGRNAIDCAMVYGGTADWASWDNPWFVNLANADQNWGRWVQNSPLNDHRQLIVNIPLIPNTATSEDWRSIGAAGGYEQYATTLAQNLVSHGVGDSVIVLGAEANGSWESDYVGSTPQQMAQWVQFWRNTVLAMRAVSGAAFQFVWAVNNRFPATPFAQYYPGDDVVDMIGDDAYDSAVTADASDWNEVYNSAGGLASLIAFANQHGKPIALPEWGVGVRDSATNAGNDDPGYMQGMGQVVAANNVAFQSYFFAHEWQTQLQQGPQSLAMYRYAFADGGRAAGLNDGMAMLPPPIYPAQAMPTFSSPAGTATSGTVTTTLSDTTTLGRPATDPAQGAVPKTTASAKPVTTTSATATSPAKTATKSTAGSTSATPTATGTSGMAMPSKTAANKGSSTKKRSAARGHVRHAAKKPAKHKRARHKAKRRAKRR
jgi:hypothetical protein